LFMVKWRPRRAVFDREVPMMGRIADAFAARPDLSGVIARNAD
ncbi:MAG: glutathione S-transferase, partial [Candidatus Saccharibacteria bacterium]|nr:glutathione S-transferase [Pseudorhodobacter sp.]